MYMTANKLRKKYLDFMKEKGHAIVPSSALVPENDPTTLFTGSGMQPMVPYLLGEKHPQGSRIADSQKCFRTQDIEEVGDNRHTTLFEMLGNWSLGDYFKKEQISWMFEFLTKEIGLDANRIYITVFRGNEELKISRDSEAVKIWQEEFSKAGIEAKDIDFAERDGLQGGRIFYYDEKKNWWSRSGVPSNMPIGEPGGPDSEMFWDFGEERHIHENSSYKNEPCHINCDCGRFLEIGNNVFMQYVKTEKGFELLPKGNIDFGGGLERMTAASNNEPDIFKTDLFDLIISKIEEVSGKAYAQEENAYAMRVIADHLKAAAFILAEGLEPSNVERGYILRRLIRRAIRYGKKLGINGIFTFKVAQIVVEMYRDIYPELMKSRDFIEEQLVREEEKFGVALEKGLKEFRNIIETHINGASMDKRLAPHSVFTLYTSYGFPIELIVEIAKESGLDVDLGAFELDMRKHQELSRAGAEQKFKGGLADHSEQTVKYHTAAHLMLAALRKVLGGHVMQKGSNITAERLRFDFSHPLKLKPEEIAKVEDLVNQKIQEDLLVAMEEMKLEDAQNQGAMGVFESRYADQVKVYTIGENDKIFSKEICGGPHAPRTGALGKFKIIKEESVSAGVRRIKAVLE